MSTNLLDDMVRRSAKVSDDDLARLDLDEALSEMLAEVAREPRTEGRQHRRGSWLARYRPPVPRIGLTRPAIAALLIVGVVAASVAAVPPVRAALDELADTLADHTLADYFDGEDPPGRSLESSDSPPAWLAQDGQTGQRVIARSGPYSLYLARSRSGVYNFGLDDSVGIGDTAAGWQRQFANNSVVILGPGTRPDADGRVPLYGVTAGDVAEVEMRYEDGSATSAPAQTGGFVLMIDPTNAPSQLVALGQDGATLQSVPAHRFALDSATLRTDAPPSHITVPQNATHIGPAERLRRTAGSERSKKNARDRRRELPPPGPTVVPDELGP